MLKKVANGFTFIEIMIVVAIIGILSGLFVTQYPATQRRARDIERRSDIKQYQIAMESYANKKGGNYPIVSGTIATNVLCNDLGLTLCPNDSQNSYEIISSGTDYVLWATLEQPSGYPTPAYFVVCSSGRSGETTVEPDVATLCPASGWQ